MSPENENTADPSASQDPSEEEKKLVIDEDWKSQAAAEKERLSQEPKGEAGPGEGGRAAGGAGQMPPASFSLLVSQWATQAAIGLGEIPNPVTGKAEPDPAQAKLAIDMLEVLEAKTQGNLTPEEKQMLDGVLFEMRMKYVSSPR